MKNQRCFEWCTFSFPPIQTNKQACVGGSEKHWQKDVAAVRFSASDSKEGTEICGEEGKLCYRPTTAFISTRLVVFFQARKHSSIGFQCSREERKHIIGLYELKAYSI